MILIKFLLRLLHIIAEILHKVGILPALILSFIVYLFTGNGIKFMNWYCLGIQDILDTIPDKINQL